MKKALSIVLAVALLFCFSVTVLASGEFDANYYSTKYPDVVKILGNDPKVLENHYITYGIKEGRYKNLTEELENSAFDPVYYATKYPDVVQAFGNDSKALLNNYQKYGSKEGRFKNALEETYGISTDSSISTDIIPVYSTYIDVSIDNQIVTYFEDGVVKFQSACVTGSPNYKGGTPTGTFSILEKIPGKRLKGPTWDCWVNRWMKFTSSSCGFHDASWRSSFGDNIYTYNGSHGCVNLPKDAAYTLYDLISVGTTVVVH
jgi:lipoprotein-anchoring transpeptidase ErfK/SrfK